MATVIEVAEPEMFPEWLAADSKSRRRSAITALALGAGFVIIALLAVSTGVLWSQREAARAQASAGQTALHASAQRLAAGQAQLVDARARIANRDQESAYADMVMVDLGRLNGDIAKSGADCPADRQT